MSDFGITENSRISRNNYTNLIKNNQQSIRKRNQQDDLSSNSRRKLLKRTSESFNQNSKIKSFQKLKKIESNKTNQSIQSIDNSSLNQNQWMNQMKIKKNISLITKSDTMPSFKTVESSLPNLAESTNTIGFKYLRTIAMHSKYGLIPQKKVLDYTTRRSTPDHKQEQKVNGVQQQQNRSHRLEKQKLQRKIKKLQQKLDEEEGWKQKCAGLEDQLKIQSQKISKLIQKISILNNQKQIKQQLLAKAQEEKEKIKSALTQQNEQKSKVYLVFEEQLKKQNKRLKNQIQKQKQEYNKLKSEYQKLQKLNQMYYQQINQFQKQKQHYFLQQLQKFKDSRQKCSRQDLSQLQNSSLHHQQNSQLQNILQQSLIKIKQQLNYYKIANYCLKKQLTQAQTEVGKRIKFQQHNQLKNRLKKLTINNRELKNQLRQARMALPEQHIIQEEYFYLTPEKDLIIRN